MNFAKAFDKVPYKRLLYKLKYYGADTNTLNWIEDFLTLRTQTLKQSYWTVKNLKKYM
jgi:hypothetical protein